MVKENIASGVEPENAPELSLLRKLEAALFPLAAAAIGIGYSAAILLNNPIESVLYSPHAIILLVLLIGIAALPLKSLLVMLGLFGSR